MKYLLLLWWMAAFALSIVLGAALGLAVWMGVFAVIGRVVAHYYPSVDHGVITVPSDASMSLFCLSLPLLPVAVLASGWAGPVALERWLKRRRACRVGTADHTECTAAPTTSTLSPGSAGEREG